MLPRDTSEPLVFLGGSSYVNSFCELTADVSSARIVLYKSVWEKKIPRCIAKRYETKERYWYYRAANDLIDGSLIIDLQ